jgi:hypothetical protein
MVLSDSDPVCVREAATPSWTAQGVPLEYLLSSGVFCKLPRDDSRTISMGSIIYHVNDAWSLNVSCKERVQQLVSGRTKAALLL